MSEGELHCHVDNLSRKGEDGKERSAVATAAYISGSDLWNEREQKVSHFSGKRDVFLSALWAPDGAPDWARDRQSLWNRVDLSARRRDSRLAKLIDAAIPREIPKKEWPFLLEEYVGTFVRLGMAAEAAIHEDGTAHNPHIHVMLTVNALKPDGFGPKLTFADQKAFLTLARTGWERLCNKHLAASGAALRLNGRSFKARGIAKKPTRHRGPNSQERRNRRAQAQALREDIPMRRSAHPNDLRLYPLLTARAEWPFADGRAPADLTPDERVEFSKLSEGRRMAAERAAEESLQDRRIGDWFAAKVETAEQAKRPWFLQPEDKSPVSASREALPPALLEAELVPGEPAWQQPAIDDFDFGREWQEERAAYEKDLWLRAIAMNRSRHEDQLMKRAEAVSPEMKKLVSDQLMALRIQKLREQDDVRRLEAFEARLGPALQEPFEDYAREEFGADYPLPGPYEELTSARELRQSQDEMIAEYQRQEPEQEREPER
jgi:hypothetical protein